MRQWVDVDIQNRLSQCWVTFDGDNRAALRSSFDLFEELAGRVAARADLIDFHHGADRHEVERILAMPA